MSTELTNVSLSNLPSVRTVDLSSYGRESNFFPRLQLYSKGRYVESGKIGPGRFGTPNQDGTITDFGDEIDILPLAVINKALDVSDPKNPIAVYDKEDPFYQDIMERSGTRDSGCMHGPSFLVYLRNEGLFEMYWGNASGRQEAPQLAPFLPVNESQAKEFGVDPKEPTPATVRTKFIERPRSSWHAPEVGKCSTPFTDLPPLEELVEAINKFENPKSNAPEEAQGEGRSR